METDYIIVGFGLAGLMTAFNLEKRKVPFIVIDKADINASKVAGGVINPLILKRFTKAWKADEFIPCAVKTYEALEKQLKKEIISSVPIYRKIKSAQEQNDWFVASDKPDIAEYMDTDLKELASIESEFDFGKVLQAKLVDTEKLIESYQAYLRERNRFFKEEFIFEELEVKPDTVVYKDIQAKGIIFCEGYNLKENPFFKTLPIIGNKGEYLIAYIPDLNLSEIIKAVGINLIPLGNDLYKVGATYSRDFTDLEPESVSRGVLIEKLEKLIDVPYSIVSTEVGVRPTVLDRRPLLGRHPIHSSLLLCNGLGTHGVMMAPALANWLIEFELEDKPLPEEVNLRRYFD